MQVRIVTKKKVKTIFYVEFDSIDVKKNRNENFVTCDLIISIQQRKINVLIEEAKENQDAIIVDYENNLDSETYNNELMETLEDKTNIN